MRWWDSAGRGTVEVVARRSARWRQQAAAGAREGGENSRDRLRGEHLQRLGWSFHRLWSTNWFHDPQAEVAKVKSAYDHAVAAADDTEPEPPAAWPPAGDPGPGHEVVRFRRSP